MAKPPTSVRSIRLPDSTWTALAERSSANGQSVNAIIAAAVDFSLAVTAPASGIMTTNAETAALIEGVVRRGPTVQAASEPMRLPRAPVGSLLKGTKK
jgi:hypothetical protein